MKLHRTGSGWVLEDATGHSAFLADFRLDDQLAGPDLPETLARHASGLAASAAAAQAVRNAPLAPVESQEVWAAGVTYYRSRDARIQESQAAGGADFYARVYEAERPELFFKATGARVVGPGQGVRIRRDARWNVPEPELVLVIDASGGVVGCTIGNDMSARDLEGENPLYLPQAKIYDGGCAVGPCLWIAREPLVPATEIRLQIQRAGQRVFEGVTCLDRLKRTPTELVEFLYRETSFPHGCLLFTGTGIVPPATFTLQRGDLIDITLEPVGTLRNFVA